MAVPPTAIQEFVDSDESVSSQQDAADERIASRERAVAKIKKFLVRVLLSELKKNETDSWIISCGDGLIVNNCETFDHKKNVTKIKVSMKGGEFRLNGKRCSQKRISLQPKHGLIKFGDNSYKGLFWLVVKDDRVQLINSVGIEDYVSASLRSEVWPGWPVEVYKVCAVAIRTYLVSKIREAKSSKELYHIKCTKEHQTYFGHDFMVRDSAVIQEAIEATRGQFLTYKGKPIVAMYDSCCGGVITSKMEGLDFKGHPYLARSYPCPYCKRSKVYNWEVEHSVEKWAEIFRKEFPKLGRIRSVKVLRRDGAGLVKEMSISDGKHTFIMTGKKLYSLGCSIKSCCFTVHKEGNNITFKGRGVGHQIGLCQRGAHEMVKDGFDYREVLLFYYPGVSFAHLY